jgi:PAS domain-containing protein/predicted  nucleic acid-binding Zn-ribbon protein
VPAAVALLSGAGSVEQATRPFLERFELHDGAVSCAEEVEQITTSEADHLTVSLDGVEADLVAVLDGDGRRMAVLTIPSAGEPADSEPASPLLEEPLDDSPAIVWLKDLDGRYVRANRRYFEQLGTDAQHVCGKTDAELTAAGSIEGLRLEEEDTAAGRELLELEYRIGAFEERPAFAVLRFALRDGEGQPTATCSVAAPVAEESLARSECERLMRIDRWGRLDALAIRQALLDEWGLTLADGSSGPPLDRDDRVAAVLLEREEALATAARLEEELSRERERRGTLSEESERAGRRAEELAGAVAAAQAHAQELEQQLAGANQRSGKLEQELTGANERSQQLEQELARASERALQLEQKLTEASQRSDELEQELTGASERAQQLEQELTGASERAQQLEGELTGANARVGEVEAELTATRAELEAHRLHGEALEAEASTPEASGIRWGTGAQRALAAALVGLTEWRSVLTHAVSTLGSEGGWDMSVAWCPDRPRGSMTCAAFWKRDGGGLTTFETRTWQHREDVSTAEFGRARSRMAPTCLLDLSSAEDPLLRAAAGEGMGSALLVPISDGGETIAMLELLSRSTTPPNAELMVSLEAIALQLGGIAALLKLTDVPRWRTGRL